MTHIGLHRQVASLGRSLKPSAVLSQDILFSDEAGWSVCCWRIANGGGLLGSYFPPGILSPLLVRHQGHGHPLLVWRMGGLRGVGGVCVCPGTRFVSSSI